jgi:gamma-glutamyltranspeptidase/glutathione hydrolase
MLVGLGALLSSVAVATSLPTTQGTGGAVASAEAAATNVGLEILRTGGNCVDAAVATALALVVVHPEAGNLGGGGFAVVKMGDELTSLDFRETAPAAATGDMYLDAEGQLRSEASEVGPLATGVPGSPRGLWELHRRFGSLPWAKIVAPAYRLAAEGFEVTTRLHKSVARKQGDLARFPETAEVWLPQGHPPAVGDRVQLPALAKALRDYGELGPEALTSGPGAQAIERVSSKYGGILRVADLEAYRPQWRPTIRFEAFGWAFATMDLPASGGIILGQTLMQLEALEFKQLPRFGSSRAHLLAEVWRRAFADRFLMGDPSTTEADSQTLLSTTWLDWRRSTIDTHRATPSSEVVSLPEEPIGESQDTTQVSVIDGQGHLVALTLTLNGAFGCKLLVPELGYFLNNEMDDFTSAPGQPNTYGLIQGEANAIAPGKRMLSSMSPTIAWNQTQSLALGGRGGSKIPTATIQVLLNILVDNDPLQTAVDRGRIHHQWLPDRLRFEADALSPENQEALIDLGHQLEPMGITAKVNAVQGLADGKVAAAGDPRGPASAGVVDPTL